MSRKDRERQQRKDQILKAARKAFAEKGFQNATMNDIAEKAEFGKATLYFYFKGKEQIFLEIIKSSVEYLGRLIDELIVEDKDATSRLTDIVKAHLNYKDKNRDLFKILFSESHKLYSDEKENIKSRIKESRQGVIRSTAQIIEDGVKSGEFRDVDPDASAYMFQGMINSVMFRWMREKRKEPMQDQASLIIDQFINGIGNRKEGLEA